MEMPLTTLVFAVYFWIKVKELKLNEKHLASKIVLLIVISFTRIDFFFTLVPIMILYESYDKDFKINIKNLFRIAIPVVGIVSIYYINNYLLYNHFLTVSGLIKSNFPKINNFGYLVSFARYQPISSFNVFITLALTLYLGIRLYSNVENREVRNFLFWIMLGFTAFVIQNVAFNKEVIREWYFAGPIYIMALVVVLNFKTHKIIASVLAIIFFLIFSLFTYSARIKLSKYDSLYDYALELKQLVSEDEKVLQMDYSGIVGLFSERKVVNGDGLINSYEFYNYVKNNRVHEYIDKYHIDYFSTYMVTIDTVKKTITDTYVGNLGGWQLTFPLHNIKYRREQNFDSYKFGHKYEWFLIRLN